VLALGILLAVALSLLAVARLWRPRGSAPRPEAKSLDDLTASAEPLLRTLPGVVKVEVLVATASPTLRIIHIRNWLLFPPRSLPQEADPLPGAGGVGEQAPASPLRRVEFLTWPGAFGYIIPHRRDDRA